MSYERLIRQADQTPFEGWDFGVFRGRFVEAEPSWEFSELLRAHMQRTSSMLDLGTGGGEFLSSLAPLPPRTIATEAYPPNVPIARRRLAPLGVRVFDTTESGDDPLPFADGTFDLAVSRHGSYAPPEVRRVLVSGGKFVTQQVGGRNLEELNHALGGPPQTYRRWNLAAATEELERAGFEVLDGREELLPGTFHDIGAVVLYLRIISWQLPDFDLAGYDAALRAWHAKMQSGTPLKVSSHRFLIIAREAHDGSEEGRKGSVDRASARHASDRIRYRQDCTKVQAENRSPARCAGLLPGARCERAQQAKDRRSGLDDWAMIQTWRQRGEDLRREAETRRLARTLRKGSPRSYRWIPVSVVGTEPVRRPGSQVLCTETRSVTE